MQTAVCDSFVVLTHCILSFSQREKWVLYTLTAIRGVETFAHESIVSITVVWQLSDSWNTLRMVLCTFFPVASKVCADIFSYVMCFKESGISRLYLSLWKQKCRNLQNYGREEKREIRWNIFFFFKISPLSTATWKWASTIMIVALVAQDNCLTFAKSVSVSLAHSISLHLKALSNFGILQCSVTQAEFAMGIDKQKAWQRSKQKAGGFLLLLLQK